MINITFPDGSVRSYEQGVTGLEIAESISPALARSVVSCGVNGQYGSWCRVKPNNTSAICAISICGQEGDIAFHPAILYGASCIVPRNSSNIGYSFA